MATYLEYISAAMRNAQYEQMEDKTWYASIPGFAGLWAVGASIEEARSELYDALDGWIAVHVKDGNNALPDVGGVNIYAPSEKGE